MKIQLDCKAIPSGPAGNSRPRLVFTGPLWDAWDHTFCVHGEKLRWTCDDCDEHDRYAAQRGGVMDFWDSLPYRERAFCCDAVAAIVEAKKREE